MTALFFTITMIVLACGIVAAFKPMLSSRLMSSKVYMADGGFEFFKIVVPKNKPKKIIAAPTPAPAKAVAASPVKKSVAAPVAVKKTAAPVVAAKKTTAPVVAAKKTVVPAVAAKKTVAAAPAKKAAPAVAKAAPVSAPAGPSFEFFKLVVPKNKPKKTL